MAVSASVFVRNRLSEIDVALMGERKWNSKALAFFRTSISSDLIGFGNQIADEVTVATTIDEPGSSSREIAIEGVFIDQYPFKK